MISSHLLLFVTGIPSKTTGLEIADLFHDIGQFRLLSLKDSNKQPKLSPLKLMSSLRRGFCIVEAQDPKSFSKAIQLAQIRFQSYTLKISKFLTGRELEEFTKDEESRRVVVKEVPQYFSQENLVRALEKTFGTVKRAFRYEISAKKQKSWCLNRNHSSYSVEFASPESAIQAVSNTGVLVPGLDHPIIIEGFKRRRQPHDNGDCQKDQVVRLAEFASCNVCESTGPHRNLPLFSASAGTKNPKDSRPEDGHRHASEVQLHWQKPTSAAYFACRGRLRSMSQADPHHLPQKGRLRFNLSVKYPRVFR